MTKKRLSDLLREEVQKSSEEAAVQELAAVAEPELAVDEGIVNNNNDDDVAVTDVAVMDADLDEIGSEPPTPADTTGSRRTARMAKADLDAMVTELQTDLQTTQEREAALQEQVGSLQTLVQEQTTAIGKLQAELEQIQALKTALDQAKQDALRLAEVNEQLGQEITSLQEQNQKLTAQLQENPSRTVTSHQLPSNLLARPVEPLSSTPKSDKFETWCYD